MKAFSCTKGFPLLLMLILVLTATAEGQWNAAVLEPVTSGPDYDMLGRHSMVLDNEGTLHAVFSRDVALDSHLFLVSKTFGQGWGAPEPIGDHGLVHSLACWIELGPDGKTLYVLYSEDYVLTLGIRSQGQWTYHTLETPYDWPYQNPAMAVDAAGIAHVVMVFHNPTGSMHHIGYGYFDGTPDFHCQIFDDFTALEQAGLWAQPIIAVNPDGSAILSYRSLYHEQTVELIVARNSALGERDWVEEVIPIPNWEPGFTGDIMRTSNGDLHYTFTTNMYWKFAKEMFYMMQPAGSDEWTAPVKVSEGYYGIFPKLAIDTRGKVHVVAQETTGMLSTGNLLYFSNASGAWTRDYLLQGHWANPTFVMDRKGNGSVIFTDEVVADQDYDVYYYGFVSDPRLGRRLHLDPSTPSFE